MGVFCQALLELGCEAGHFERQNEASYFLNFLIPKLPAPREEDLSRGILEAIDMDSYRVEVKTGLEIGLVDQDAEIEPAPLSDIIQAFNDQFDDIDWKDADKIRQIIAEEIPGKVAAPAAAPPETSPGDSAPSCSRFSPTSLQSWHTVPELQG